MRGIFANKEARVSMQKNQTPLMSRFIIFSISLFLVILIGGSIAFIFSMRQIIRTNKGNELSQMLEIERIKLETSVNNEIAIALKMARSPLIQLYFANPDDPELAKLTFAEINAYRYAFANNSLFWVNDIDRMFYSDDNEPYWVDAENPVNYWYNMTLYETEVYNFNINYNPDLQVTKLWINAPVFDVNKEPIGMLGTGIDISTFIDAIYKNYSGNAELYFFNAAGEITGSKYVTLVAAKRNIEQELGETGSGIIANAKSIKAGETKVLNTLLGNIAIGTVPLLGWYSVAVMPDSIADYNTAMTALFLVVLAVMVLIFIVFNLFIFRFLKSLRTTMESLKRAKNETERIMNEKLEYSKKFSKALAKMTKLPTVSAGFLKEAADVIAKEGCDTLESSRIGIWRFVEKQNVLESIAYYDASKGEHTIQEEFSLSDREEYSTLLVSERMIVMNDVEECKLITNAIYGNDYLCAAIDAPIRVDGKLFGVVCVEQGFGGEFVTGRKWTIEEQNFVSSLADLMALAISGFERRKAQTAAEEANKSKSNFLASMSHEIRTPMNAITGMAELLLRGEIPDEARGYAQDIKHAGNNLISIINDILDFSKIEAGKLEIIPVKYMLSSLVNDTVNIIRMRIGEKPLRFFTNIDGSIPNNLIGDEVRLRQILLNLLSNAVKYSEKGHIGLFITIEKRDDNQVSQNKFVLLKIAVSDTGKGIKPEDQEKLFGEFAQVDTEKNRGIEGTGLGLAITKRLCMAMGGDIGVESDYGSGSVFTAIIPQGIESEAPFAAVEEAEKKRVLIYERRTVYAKSIDWSLENMKVPHTLVTNPGDFTNALLREEWFYVFSGRGLYKEIRPVMERVASSFPEGKEPPIALMGEWENEANIPNVRFVSLPVQSLSIANVLNGKADSHGIGMPGYLDGSGSGGMVRYTFPGARLLVVDDIATNLKVAEGLLAPYQAEVDTCSSGKEAIELVKNRDYDIVFMDHLMPEMDGIEATAAVRAWERISINNEQVPIIALTANAVVGMKEMFIEKGFNDFLAKPIDVSKLDEILSRWIPKEKRDQGLRDQGASLESIAGCQQALITNNNPSSYNIPGVDIKQGIAMTGGNMELYKKVLAVFRKDLEKRLPLLQTMPAADALSLFVTQVHALKSASASIGAAEVSARAAKIEAAGKAGDLVFIGENLSGFADSLAKLVRSIAAALELETVVTPNKTPAAGSFITLLRELDTALQSQKTSDIDRILEELMRQQPDKDLKAALEQISDEVLMAEYDKAGETLAGLLDKEGDPQAAV